MEQKLRVWKMRNFRTTRKEVKSPEEAKVIIRKAIKRDLLNENVQDNAFGLEVYEDVDNIGRFEWNEWYNEETGNDIVEEIDEEDENNNN